MSNPLDPVRIAFDKAVGPHQQRQNLIAVLKEEDVGKETPRADGEGIDQLDDRVGRSSG